MKGMHQGNQADGADPAKSSYACQQRHLGSPIDSIKGANIFENFRYSFVYFAVCQDQQRYGEDNHRSDDRRHILDGGGDHGRFPFVKEFLTEREDIIVDKCFK